MSLNLAWVRKQRLDGRPEYDHEGRERKALASGSSSTHLHPRRHRQTSSRALSHACRSTSGLEMVGDVKV